MASSRFTNAGSTALLTVFDQIIPANSLGSTGKLKIELVGDHITATSSTVRVLITWGGTPIFDFTASSTNTNAGRALFWLKFILQAWQDNQHQILSDGDFRYDQYSGLTVGAGNLNPQGRQFIGPGTINVDSTLAQHLVVQIQQSSAATANEKRLAGTIELVK